MSQKINTLVVDDEAGVRFFIDETLTKAGYVVRTAASGQEALDRLRDDAYQLMILDLKLGGRVDGLKVLEAVRWRWPATVVIMLTGHGSLESAMAAIREGVDGYLLKPVDPSELRQAVKEALERRARLGTLPKKDETRTLESGPFVIDLAKHTATAHGQPLDLTPREFNLLAHLIRNAGRVVTPKELVQAAQGYECDNVYEARQIVKWYIHRLRHKIEPEPSKPSYVLNVRGVGYRFAG
ncbi:MAG: response regulator transcription factor [Anaerolineae bacterium]|nr:response regulator transcription factor [Anaerolineae bacterium]